MGLTAPRRRALEILIDQGEPMAPRDVAMALWPDSPAWERRNRGQRGTNHSGAMAGTMPMLAAKLLWRLADDGYAGMVNYRWVPSEKGRSLIATLKERGL